MTARYSIATSALIAALATLPHLGCGDDGPPGETYFDRNIQPILTQSCAGNVAGCHEPNLDDPFEFVAGNFDVSSFEAVQKRPDVLRTFGAYPVPLLLIKAVGNTGELGFNYEGEFVPLEVEHVGGTNLRVGSDSYLTLLQWLENGATENGLPPPAPPSDGDGPCSTLIPAGFDEAEIVANPDFDSFRSSVQPVLEGCNSRNCHGAPAGDFYIACGTNDRQLAWNFEQVQAFVDEPVANSQVLNVPLAVNEGGLFHSGGEHFSSRDDSGYQALSDWAERVGRSEFGEGDPGQTYYRQHVQPILVKRGCSFEACHSPVATNDLKLRAGSQGFFASVALEKNYDVLLEDSLAIEMPDARRGRAVAKGILPRFGGIGHRGGPVLETPGSGGADPANCARPIDPTDPATSAFCIVQGWIDIEREARITAGTIKRLDAADTVTLVYVQRNNNTDVATPLEFDTYQPNSDLLAVDLAIDAVGGVSLPSGNTDPADGANNLRSLIGACGVAVADADVSSPSVNPTGTEVTFSMRAAAGGARQVYVVDLPNGATCTQVTATEADVGGIKIHNFDPVFSPEGDYIVFASTRGTAAGAPSPSYSRQLFLPQSDLFRIQPNGSGLEQMTFLTNSEVNPQIMREGRVIMTTEKISKGFYQLSGRRLNWDLTDYHPLLAQRAESGLASTEDPDATLPSIGYQQATDIRESSNGDFIFILSDPGAAAGAGTLGVFNRSVGPFEANRGVEGSNTFDPGYLESLSILDPAATGRVGSNTVGAFKSPADLLDGRLLVSYSGFTGDLGTATTLDFDLVMVNKSGVRTPLVVAAGQQVQGVLVIPHPPREGYKNFRQLVFGGGVDTDTTGGPEFAVVHITDAPLIFTLLTANLRRGRPLDFFADATRVAAYQERPATNRSPNTDEGIFEDRVLLGAADLRSDGSVKVRLPASMGIILELQDDSGNPVVTMGEEHQLGPGEVISMGVVAELFNGTCGGCHGSISGRETDVFVTPDILTGASKSLSQNEEPTIP